MMKAAVFYEPGNISIENLTEPVPAEDEVVVKVGAAAICGTDIKIFKNGHPKINLPRVLGHEFAGTVKAVGAGIDNILGGERVLVAAPIGCGKCYFCQQGRENYCSELHVFGYDYDGSFAEYVRIPPEAVKGGNLIPLPETVSFEEASLIEPLSCCLNGQQPMQVGAGDTVAIFGAGTIGCMHAELARAQGVERIMLVDNSPEKLEFIKERFTSFNLIDSSREDPVETIRKQTEGTGASVVIVACPVVAVHKPAMLAAARLGRISFFAGVPRDASTMDFDINLLHYEALSIYGSFGSSVRQHLETLELLSAGKVNLKPFITHRYGIDDVPAAMESKEVFLKRILSLGEEKGDNEKI